MVFSKESLFCRVSKMQREWDKSLCLSVTARKTSTWSQNQVPAKIPIKPPFSSKGSLRYILSKQENFAPPIHPIECKKERLSFFQKKSRCFWVSNIPKAMHNLSHVANSKSWTVTMLLCRLSFGDSNLLKSPPTHHAFAPRITSAIWFQKSLVYSCD